MSLYLRTIKRKVDGFAIHPHLTQTNIREYLMGHLSQTEYGRRFNLTDSSQPHYHLSNLPIVKYEDIADDIQSMMMGGKDVLWPGVVKYFAKSSGTTNDKSKFIPITNNFLNKNIQRTNWDVASIVYDQVPNAGIFRDKSLLMGGSMSKYEPFPSTLYGDISALMIHLMPRIARPYFTPSFETATMPDWEEKISRMCVEIDHENVFLFGGVPTWTMVLFEKILERYGVDTMSSIWPNARVYLHGGVGFEPYRRQFEDYFPRPDFNYLEAYNASEGYFAIQNNVKEEGMLLLLNNGIYYEFIPVSELSDPSAILYGLNKVTTGIDYALVISTCSGLWRYMTGDTIQFTSLSPYKIKVSGRTQQFINAFGEEVMIGNTDMAIAKVSSQFGVGISDYTVAPIYLEGAKKGGHEWLIEFNSEPDSLEQFGDLLDRELKNLNSDYEAKRYKEMALEPPIIKSLPQGTFVRWMELQGKLGGQHKVPRLHNSRKYVDKILGFIDEST